jgi:hypothetical protein
VISTSDTIIMWLSTVLIREWPDVVNKKIKVVIQEYHLLQAIPNFRESQLLIKINMYTV